MDTMPETEKERHERQIAELKGRVDRIQLGLGGTILVLAAIVVWALFFRSAAPSKGQPSTLLQGPKIPSAGRLV